ncbi:MAG: prolyl oligopeptidase family serine peptidase [Planctomycetaceae bacterium]|nr:prolyl oligopeptidase family serine peptidase [Planctomycetaceae bacterium]
MSNVLRAIALVAVWQLPVVAADDPAPSTPAVDTSRGDALVAEYFRLETERIERESFADIRTLEDWTSRRDEYRRQLHEMLGIDPLPEKTPLEPVVTGTVDHPEFTVEKLHFQSQPGLYVTASLYVPKGLTGAVPAVLYVCGHAQVFDGERSLGNKAGYQHHGAWFARHGYVCLTIDTLQLGEVPGVHHGTYNLDRWWWNSRGYTPAGVEAWNCIRALDYLETRPEVDMTKVGVTGRSGGGAYSWWIAALDDRIACAVPVAGITTLRNHVVDGCVEGHCDCMFTVNTYGWDYAQVAALVAPRPLLISNTDKDNIFPLDGVVNVHEQVRQIYKLYGAEDKLGLQITEGPHEDTQELHIHAFVWMNRFLKGEETPIDLPAAKLFEPKQLQVFADLPQPERNSTIDEEFVPSAAEPAVPENADEWAEMRDAWLKDLREKCFRAWPADSPNDALTLNVAQTVTDATGELRISWHEFTSQAPYRLPLVVIRRDEEIKSATLRVADQESWANLFWNLLKAKAGSRFGDGTQSPRALQLATTLAVRPEEMVIVVAPRGVGPTEWTRDERERVQVRRRFMLLGQTDHSARVYDVRRAMQAARQIAGPDTPLTLHGERDAAVWALYASLFEPPAARLSLMALPSTHRDGPDFLNVLRVLDLPQAAALAAERSPIELNQPFNSHTSGIQVQAWRFPTAVTEKLAWGERFTIVAEFF